MAKDKFVEVRKINTRGQVIFRSQSTKRPVFNKQVSVEGNWYDLKEENGQFYIEIIDDVPEPGDPLDPPDPEFDRLLAWFVQEREGIKEHLNAERVILTDQGIKIIPKTPKMIFPALTRRLS